mmetsp:Transcript_41582/g.70180  ORF Transcript_41582/g.70180 Transcript_41582/m.70180 type:complete len:672 (+) Transcript_41582:724-2739(+)
MRGVLCGAERRERRHRPGLLFAEGRGRHPRQHAAGAAEGGASQGDGVPGAQRVSSRGGRRGLNDMQRHRHRLQVDHDHAEGRGQRCRCIGRKRCGGCLRDGRQRQRRGGADRRAGRAGQAAAGGDCGGAARRDAQHAHRQQGRRREAGREFDDGPVEAALRIQQFAAGVQPHRPGPGRRCQKPVGLESGNRQLRCHGRFQDRGHPLQDRRECRGHSLRLRLCLCGGQCRRSRGGLSGGQRGAHQRLCKLQRVRTEPDHVADPVAVPAQQGVAHRLHEALGYVSEGPAERAGRHRVPERSPAHHKPPAGHAGVRRLLPGVCLARGQGIPNGGVVQPGRLVRRQHHGVHERRRVRGLWARQRECGRGHRLRQRQQEQRHRLQRLAAVSDGGGRRAAERQQRPVDPECWEPGVLAGDSVREVRRNDGLPPVGHHRRDDGAAERAAQLRPGHEQRDHKLHQEPRQHVHPPELDGQHGVVPRDAGPGRAGRCRDAPQRHFPLHQHHHLARDVRRLVAGAEAEDAGQPQQCAVLDDAGRRDADVGDAEVRRRGHVADVGVGGQQRAEGPHLREVVLGGGRGGQRGADPELQEWTTSIGGPFCENAGPLQILCHAIQSRTIRRDRNCHGCPQRRGVCGLRVLPHRVRECGCAHQHQQDHVRVLRNCPRSEIRHGTRHE